MNRWTRWISATAAVLALGCGEIDVPNLNNLPTVTLTRAPTRGLVLSASTGLLIGTRFAVAQPNGYVAMLGILGRESYNFDRADPRFISEMLEAPALDPASPAFGGNFWGQPYANIRNANSLITALDAVPNVTGEEKSAIRGFARTIMALDFLMVAMTRYSAPEGCGPVDVNRPVGDPLAPIVSKDEMLTHIFTLLDEAKTDLEGGGSTFPFALSSGFDGFDTPATFLKVNRALQARVQVYRSQWAAAKTALDASFVDGGASFALGAYHSYGNGSGDRPNGLISPNLFAHPKLVTEAEAGDARLSKIRTLPETTTLRGISSDKAFTLYQTGDSPVPIVRNEELILLRAEIAAQQGDFATVLADVNLIRTTHLLPAKVAADLDTLGESIDEILQQRRYSLMFEGGHRWIDLRRYGRLSDPGLKDLPTHNVHETYLIPIAEMDARGG